MKTSHETKPVPELHSGAESLLVEALRKSRRVASLFDEEIRGDADGCPDYKVLERALREFASARKSLKLALQCLRTARRGEPGGGGTEDPAPGTPEAERRARVAGLVVKDTSPALTALPGGRS